MLPSVSLGKRIEYECNAGVNLPPAHVGPSAAAAAAVVGLGPLEESSGQQDPEFSRRRPSRRLMDFMGGQREGSPDQLSPDDDPFGGRRPPSDQLQQRPVAVDIRGDGPDLPSTDSGSPRPAQGCPGSGPAGYWLSYPVVVGFCILTFNSFMAAYRCWGDTGAISFVVSTYLTLVGLFFTINKFQAAPLNSKKRQGLKACVWMFTVALTFGFMYQIDGTTTKPTLNMTLLLWMMPAATGASVFIIFCETGKFVNLGHTTCFSCSVLHL